MFTIYTDKIKTAGQQRGPFVLIRPEYKDDRGLHEHEKVHVTQWLRVTGAVCLFFAFWYFTTENPWALAFSPLAVAAHGLAYKLIPTYRLHCELEAYAEQADYYPDDRTELFGKYIADDYNLDISAAHAAELIREYRS